MTGQSDQEIIDSVSAALDTAMELAAEEEGWEVSKEQEGAVVKTKKNKEGRRVWLCSATVNVSAGVLWEKLSDTDNLTSWNNTLTTSKIIKSLSPDVKVTYQITSEGGGGVVSARDFVYGCKTLIKDKKKMIGGLSVTLEDQPEVGGVVRASHGPGLLIVEDIGEADRCKFVWLMDCDYRGMIPTSIIEIAMPNAQLQVQFFSFSSLNFK